VDLSLLGFDAADLDAMAGGESWEAKTPVIKERVGEENASLKPDLQQKVDEEQSIRNTSISAFTATERQEEVSTETVSPVVRPESATSAWIEHCRQLEAQLALTRNSSTKDESVREPVDSVKMAPLQPSSLSSDKTSIASNATSPPPPPSSPPPPPPPPPPPQHQHSQHLWRPQSQPQPQPQPEPQPIQQERPRPQSAPASAPMPNPNSMSLQDILDELTVLYDRAGRGLHYDEARLELLQGLQESNAEYREQVAAEQEAWRRSVDAFLCESLLRMRSYVPPDIFSTTIEALLHLGLTPELARRVLTKKCLWLTRMSMDEIARLHEADLNGRFSTQGENLDLVELAAIYASLPERFVNDRLCKKVEWRDGIERTLRDWLGSEEAPGCVPDGRARHDMYEAFLDDTGPVRDTTTVREVDVVSSAGSQGPRNSFQEVCKRHSILRRRSFAGDGNSESDASFSSITTSP